VSFADDRVTIQITPDLRKKLKVMVAERGLHSYDELIEQLLKEKGYWKEE